MRLEDSDATWAVVPRAWLPSLLHLFELTQTRESIELSRNGSPRSSLTDSRALRLQMSQLLLLDDLLARDLDAQLELDDRAERVRAELRNWQGVEPAGQPKGFEGQLRPYQQIAVGWFAFLRRFQLGGCLADDMGLGKTVQVIAHLQAVRRPR